MAQELVNKAAFAGGPAAAFRGMGMDESLSDGIGGGYPLIRYGGKTWSIDVRGQNYKFVDDKGYPMPYLDVIILRQAQNKSKAYFENYEEGSRDAPVCSSLDGIVPDPGVLHKQSDTCAMCPQNVFKPNDRGTKVKACGDAKRLAVVPMPEQTKKLLGQPLVEPVFLRVPAASLVALARMGDESLKMGYPYFSFVTRINFDPEKSYPKMEFAGIQKLGDAEAAKIMELREDPQSYRICSGDATSGVKHLNAPAAQPAVTFNASAPAPGNLGLVQEPDPNAAAHAAVPPPSGETGLIAAEQRAALAARLKADREARVAAIHAEAVVEEAAKATPAQPTIVSQHTLELKANPLAPAPTVPPAASTVDTGEPEQSDAALDELIGSLLPR